MTMTDFKLNCQAAQSRDRTEVVGTQDDQGRLDLVQVRGDDVNERVLLAIQHLLHAQQGPRVLHWRGCVLRGELLGMQEAWRNRSGQQPSLRAVAPLACTLGLLHSQHRNSSCGQQCKAAKAAQAMLSTAHHRKRGLAGCILCVLAR
jgi:hypothetical protein